MHCIMNWLQSNQDQSCCMCRRPWEFQEKDGSNKLPEPEDAEEEEE